MLLFFPKVTINHNLSCLTRNLNCNHGEKNFIKNDVPDSVLPCTNDTNCSELQSSLFCIRKMTTLNHSFHKDYKFQGNLNFC